jgi:hypothetical protein
MAGFGCDELFGSTQHDDEEYAEFALGNGGFGCDELFGSTV